MSVNVKAFALILGYQLEKSVDGSQPSTDLKGCGEEINTKSLVCLYGINV